MISRKKGKNSGIICSFCREKIFFTLEIKYLFIIMTTPAKELGITGFFRINEGIFPKSEKWLPFTNLEIKYDLDSNIMITTFKGEENENEEIVYTIKDIKHIKYNNEIRAKRGILRGSLIPKPNRIDFEGQWNNEYSNWSFSIDNPENYNTIVAGIRNNLYNQQVQHKSVKRETELENLVNDYKEKGILSPDATVDDYLNYELNKDLKSSDKDTRVAAEYHKERNYGGGKTRKRKSRASRKKRTKYKKRATTKKHKKNKKNKKRPRTRKR
jgi:hypothetical protein